MRHLLLLGAAESTTAGVVTSFATVITAVGGLLLALAVLIPILRTARKSLSTLNEVHTLVNQQHTDLTNYNIALMAALKAAGITVPPDQSKGVAALEPPLSAPTPPPPGPATRR